MRKLQLDELGRSKDYNSVKKQPITVVLDNIRSMNNVGSVFRSSDAFAIEHVILCGITAQPPHREIHKTAIGAENTVPWTHFSDTLSALEKLKEEGYQLIGIEQTDQSIPLDQFQPDTTKKYALVLGNEVFGISDDAINVIDHCIEIPQFGTKHSLNISVATGVVLWDFTQKLGFAEN